MNLLKHLFSVALLALLVCIAFSQGREGRPDDPAETARHIQVNNLLNQAMELRRSGSPESAIPIYQQAAAIEAQMAGVDGRASFELARTLMGLGRQNEALEAYRHVFSWDARRGDLDGSGGHGIFPIMEYAILLAKQGRAEDAKAIYYYGLRNFNTSERDREPVPFLTVFDPEPEGTSWPYSLERLQAAALMIEAIEGGYYDVVSQTRIDPDDLIDRVKILAPDWFYPVMYAAAGNWSSERGEQLLNQAESLARPGVEKDLIAAYRVQLAEHRANMIAENTPGADDKRKVTEGNARRKRMQCLVPNEQTLRRLSVDRAISNR